MVFERLTSAAINHIDYFLRNSEIRVQTVKYRKSQSVLILQWYLQLVIQGMVLSIGAALNEVQHA